MNNFIIGALLIIGFLLFVIYIIREEIKSERPFISVNVSDEDLNATASDVLLNPPKLVIHHQDLKIWADPKWKYLSGEKASTEDFIKFHLDEAEGYFQDNQEATNKLQELKTILGVSNDIVGTIKK